MVNTFIFFKAWIFLPGVHLYFISSVILLWLPIHILSISHISLPHVSTFTSLWPPCLHMERLARMLLVVKAISSFWESPHPSLFQYLFLPVKHLLLTVFLVLFVDYWRIVLENVIVWRVGLLVCLGVEQLWFVINGNSKEVINLKCIATCSCHGA